LDSATEIIQILLETNKELTKQIVDLSRALAERGTPLPSYPQGEFSKEPLWVPETEEDARALYASGEIDKTQLEDALREIGFMNAELVIPTGI
jgi:hypothetical protein